MTDDRTNKASRVLDLTHQINALRGRLMELRADVEAAEREIANLLAERQQLVLTK